MLKPSILVPRRKAHLFITIAAFSFIALLLLLASRSNELSSIRSSWGTDADGNAYGPGSTEEIKDDKSGDTKTKPKAKFGGESKFHMLLPATKGNVNFCKTLLTMVMLGYPTPTIIGWGFGDDQAHMKGGGSHFMKITNSLDYIENHERNGTPEFEDEIVFMLDAYDIWFQLPAEVLLKRFEAIKAAEDARVAQRLGKAFNNEDLHTGVIFGAGKRCIPNMPYTISCYPVPDSPVPHDLYGSATDTGFGVTSASAYRTRYLNSGFLIGTVKYMRPLLKQAKAKMEICKDARNRPDDVLGWSYKCYGGSDQSIFIEMLGEQEYHREIMRRHHRNAFDGLLDRIIPGRAGSWPKPWNIYGAMVTDPLAPEFPHNQHSTEYHSGKKYEYGIALDYFSELGHQAIHAERDTAYVTHDKPVDKQFGKFSPFDCRNKHSTVSSDLATGEIDFLAADGGDQKTWKSVPLFSEVCMDSIPVMIHHNAMDKSRIEKLWDRPWWNGRSKAIFDWRKEQEIEQLTTGIPTDSDGLVLKWDELCPAEYNEELFRDKKKE